MALNIFVDTNILIDFILQRPFDIESTNRLFLLAQNHEVNLHTSESPLLTTNYITNQPAQIEKLIFLLKVICIPGTIIQSAFGSNFKDKEDAVLYYGALNSKMDYFITRNERDFKKYAVKQLPVISVKQFFKTAGL